MSFVLVPNGRTPNAYDVNAIIQALEGIANAGQPISMTALSDAASYALDVRNLGTGGLGLRVKDSAGNTLLTVNDTGLTAKTMYVNGTAGAGFIDLVGQASNPAAPAAGSARFHTATMQGFTRFEQDNEAATNLVLGRDNVFIARNTSDSDIVKGRAVYVTGSTGNVPNIALAKANSLTTLPAIGVTLDAIANNAYGQVMKLGVMSSVDTSAFSSGDRLFVSAATAGVFTATRPAYPNFAQRIGSVLVSGVGNGSLSISMAPFLGGEETGTAGDFTVGGSLTVGSLAGYIKGTAGLLSGQVGVPWGDLTSVPSTFAPSAHASAHHSGGGDALALGSIAGNIGTAQHGSLGTISNAHAWADINKATSSIADIATRSHTSLTDIGTNAHTAIDTHIGATGSSVHGLGSISTQAANSVAITGGSVTGLTALAQASGIFYVNDTANTQMTTGATLNMGGADNEILALKSSDVTHTGTGRTEADTFGHFRKVGATTGGMLVEALATDTHGIVLSGVCTTADATRSTAGTGPIVFQANIISGGNLGALAADKNMACFTNNGSTKAIVDSDGDVLLDAVASDNQWDEHDDMALLETYRVLSAKPTNYRQLFARDVTQHAQVLHETGVLTLNNDGHHFFSVKGLFGLVIDGMRQLADGQRSTNVDIAGRLSAIESKLAALPASAPPAGRSG